MLEIKKRPREFDTYLGYLSQLFKFGYVKGKKKEKRKSVKM